MVHRLSILLRLRGIYCNPWAAIEESNLPGRGKQLNKNNIKYKKK